MCQIHNMPYFIKLQYFFLFLFGMQEHGQKFWFTIVFQIFYSGTDPDLVDFKGFFLLGHVKYYLVNCSTMYKNNIFYFAANKFSSFSVLDFKIRASMYYICK